MTPSLFSSLTPVVVMRMCAQCNGVFCGYNQVGGDSEPYFCPKCARVVNAAVQPVPGDTVKHIDHRSGPFTSLVVISVDDGWAVVQPIGFPDRRRTVSCASLVRR